MSPRAVTADSVLRLEDAAFGYGERAVVTGVDLEITAGEVVAVLGPNGSGKSTLVKGVLGLNDLVAGSVSLFGVAQEDFGGYPDCRADFVSAMEQALRLGLDFPLRLLAPLMHLDKAATVRLAAELPGCLEALALSHTCYEGAVPPCGSCHACLLRAKGFAGAGVPDPLLAWAR